MVKTHGSYTYRCGSIPLDLWSLFPEGDTHSHISVLLAHVSLSQAFFSLFTEKLKIILSKNRKPQ